MLLLIGIANQILEEIEEDFLKSVNLMYLSPHLCSHELIEATEMICGQLYHEEDIRKIFHKLQQNEEAPQKLLCCLTTETRHLGHKDIANKLAIVMEKHKLKWNCPQCSNQDISIPT